MRTMRRVKKIIGCLSRIWPMLLFFFASVNGFPAVATAKNSEFLSRPEIVAGQVVFKLKKSVPGPKQYLSENINKKGELHGTKS